MKILAYSHRKDETEFFKEFSEKYNVKIVLTKKEPSLDTAELVEKFHELGVKFISTRTIGYDHIDLQEAKKLGVNVGNATYSPNSVADYTIMMMLMATRKMKLIMDRSNTQDYSLTYVQGKELPNLTVGVIGTGRIGRTVIKHLSGFGCEILAHDIYEQEEVKSYGKYVELEYLFENSDIITLHMPATDDNYHMINKQSLNKMKDGIFIINTARGSLINTDDFIEAIENGKIGGAALDVIEHEAGIYYNDLKGQILSNKDLAILKSFPNVIVTPHTAFYTNQAVSDMVESSIKSCILFEENKDNPWQVI